MNEQGYISDAEYQEAVNTPLADTLDVQPISTGCMAADYDAGYFCDYVVHKILNSKEFGKTSEDRERLLKDRHHVGYRCQHLVERNRAQHHPTGRFLRHGNRDGVRQTGYRRSAGLRSESNV